MICNLRNKGEAPCSVPSMPTSQPLMGLGNCGVSVVAFSQAKKNLKHQKELDEYEDKQVNEALISPEIET